MITDNPLEKPFGPLQQRRFQFVVGLSVDLPVVGAVLFNLHSFVVESDTTVGGGISGHVAAMDVV